jgi:hypothetical protein
MDIDFIKAIYRSIKLEGSRKRIGLLYRLIIYLRRGDDREHTTNDSAGNAFLLYAGIDAHLFRCWTAA